MDWILDNKDWLFSGIAIAIPLAIIGWLIGKKKNSQTQNSGDNSTNIQVGKSIKFNKTDKDD